MLLPFGMISLLPDDLEPILTVADIGVVATDDLRALRNQEVLACDSVVDRLGDLADDLAGKVTVEAGDQGGRE